VTRARCALFAGAAAWAVVALSAPGRAQVDTREGIALQNQILELRRDMQTLQGQAGRGGAIPQGGGSYQGGSSYLAPRSLAPPPAAGGGDGGDLTAQLLGRVQALEEQVRALRGQLDEVTNTTQRQNAELSKQLGDTNFALQQGGGRAPAGASAPPPVSLTSPPPSSLGSGPAPPPPAPPATGAVRRTPELALQEGNAALARRDYATAEAAARDVLSGSRTSPRAYDAQFVLAQSLAGQRNYAQAAIAYDDTYNRSRTGRHAPDALLGLANALASIGEKRAACDTLTKLASEFPRASGDVRDGASATRQRAGCR